MTRVYDNAGRLTEVENVTGGGSVLSDFVSTLDRVGNPSQIAETIGGATNTIRYGYDASDRLTGVCFAGACTGGADIAWTYDKVGNRLTETRAGGSPITYGYNALDELTQAGSTGFTYDRNGNELTAGATVYSYDLANRLKTAKIGTTTTTYTYDGDGARLQASTGSQASKKTNFLWHTTFGLPQLALERDGNNALLRRYVYGDSCLPRRLHAPGRRS